MVHLTTLAAAEKHQPTTPYTIGDLLDREVRLGCRSWRDVAARNRRRLEIADGRGGSLLLLGDVVFVMNTDEKHREAAGSIAALRKHGRAHLHPRRAPARGPCGRSSNRTSPVSFTDVPLATAVEELAALAKIDLRLDRAALRAASIRERSPVTFELADQTLATALQGLLAELNLTWVLRDGVLWITSQEDAGNFRKRRSTTRDLCRDDADSSALRQALIGQTHGPWSDEQTAPGGSISFPKVGVMIVRQTGWRPRRSVATARELSHRAQGVEAPPGAPGVDPKELVVRYYRVSTVIADRRRRSFAKLVDAGYVGGGRSSRLPRERSSTSCPSTSSVIGAEGFDVVEQGVGCGPYAGRARPQHGARDPPDPRSARQDRRAARPHRERRLAYESLGGMGGGGMGGGMGGGASSRFPFRR